MRHFIFLFALIASPVFAQAPDSFSLHIGSHHVNAQEEFEEFNPGFFLNWERSGGVTYSLGAYRNSYGRTSVAGTLSKDILTRERFGIAAFAGLANYPGDGDRFRISAGDVIPLVGLRLDAEPVFVTVLPAGGDAADAIISFGLTFPLNF